MPPKLVYFIVKKETSTVAFQRQPTKPNIPHPSPNTKKNSTSIKERKDEE
jgi:hypothetical protein